MKLKSIIEAIRKREFGYYASRRIFRYFERKKPDLLPFASDYIFDNRKHDSNNLLIVLLGFQPFYWDVVLDRVKRNVDQFAESVDVCLCVPCGANTDAWGGARRFAEKYGFSFLRIKDDLLAQAQNTAIQLHPNANWIYKIDEDIILSDNYLKKLKQAYVRYEMSSYYPIGFVSPLINLNAGGFKIFLNSIGKWEEFISMFPSQHYWDLDSTDNQKDIIHKNEFAAEYIWKQSIPFDEISKVIESTNEDKYSVCPIRMSIGAILFTRDRWGEWGYFDVKGVSVLGVEEKQVCAHTINHMQAIVIAEDTFVGHLGFFRQKETCHHFFEQHFVKDK